MKSFLLTFLSFASLSIAKLEPTCENKDANCTSPADRVAAETAVDYHYYNPDLHANNIIEVTLDKEVLKEIRAGYDKDIHPHYESAKSTDDFCLVAPYSQKTMTFQFIKEVRSDIRWYSVRNKETYDRYLELVKKLGLIETIKDRKWVDEDDEPIIYSMFFIPRSFSNKHEFHDDWPEEIGTQITTFLIPMSDDFNIGLAYLDNDMNPQSLQYTYGKGYGVGGGLRHSTDTGKSETQDVLLCVYVGSSKKKKVWKWAKKYIADELEHYMNPFKGFVLNDNFKREGVTSKCQ
mmetsp:Transcript_2031/g.2879  ORF Transcript_2031/g.2879 Transcript_2031/m.2879 type:complete len:291 (+) Transcript_2031:71-943(+)